MFNIEYYPDAGNEYNQDYWRTFYRTLENICYLIECKSIQ